MANTTIPIELSSTPGIVDNSNATAITIDSSENVGIGTSSPQARLHVNNALAGNGTIHLGSATYYGLIEHEATVTGANKYTVASASGGGHIWYRGSTEQMRIDSAGNVGIGKTPNRSRKLEVAGNINLDNGGSLEWEDGGVGITGSGATDTMTFATAGAEHMRIDSVGRLLSGTTSPIQIERLGIQFNGGNSIGIALKTTASDGYLQRFFDSSGTNQGNIYLATNGTVSFNNLSDYRVKENVVTDWDATTRLKQLKPSRFNFIADSTNTTVDGFLAHEVEDIVPEAITGTKDATEELTNVVINNVGNVIARDIEEDDWIAGKEDETYPSDSTWEASHTANVYQGIDQSKLVPLLTKALQEQQALIESLEARITTLEG